MSSYVRKFHCCNPLYLYVLQLDGGQLVLAKDRRRKNWYSHPPGWLAPEQSPRLHGISASWLRRWTIDAQRQTYLWKASSQGEWPYLRAWREGQTLSWYFWNMRNSQIIHGSGLGDIVICDRPPLRLTRYQQWQFIDNKRDFDSRSKTLDIHACAFKASAKVSRRCFVPIDWTIIYQSRF